MFENYHNNNHNLLQIVNLSGPDNLELHNKETKYRILKLIFLIYYPFNFISKT